MNPDLLKRTAAACHAALDAGYRRGTPEEPPQGNEPPKARRTYYRWPDGSIHKVKPAQALENYQTIRAASMAEARKIAGGNP